MKNRSQWQRIMCGLLGACAMMWGGRGCAQGFLNLYTFSGSDGHLPYVSLVSSNILYGLTIGGGSALGGRIFQINTDGTGFSPLYDFIGPTPNTNNDGAFPRGRLILSDRVLYGVTWYGGTSDQGTIFAMDAGGAWITNLHSFGGIDAPAYTNSDGAQPAWGLTIAGNTLFGTTPGGGLFAGGTLFSINTDGTGFTNLHNFGGAMDGASPLGTLLLSATTLYGTTLTGGGLRSTNGTLFRIGLDGSGYTNFYVFAGGSMGAAPSSGLKLLGKVLYGETSNGGVSNNGTVFKINPNGTGFVTLHNFSGSDGSAPSGELSIAGGTFYGATVGGGSSNCGTVFAINADGTGFRNLYALTGWDDGANPEGGVIWSSNALFGATSQSFFGGEDGVLFSLGVAPPSPPPLSIILSGSTVILQWPTNGPSFSLQASTNLTPPMLWSKVSAIPAIFGGENSVTLPAIGPQKFYRLTGN